MRNYNILCLYPIIPGVQWFVICYIICYNVIMLIYFYIMIVVFSWCPCCYIIKLTWSNWMKVFLALVQCYPGLSNSKSYLSFGLFVLSWNSIEFHSSYCKLCYCSLNKQCSPYIFICINILVLYLVYASSNLTEMLQLICKSNNQTNVVCHENLIRRFYSCLIFIACLFKAIFMAIFWFLVPFWNISYRFTRCISLQQYFNIFCARWWWHQ